MQGCEGGGTSPAQRSRSVTARTRSGIVYFRQGAIRRREKTLTDRPGVAQYPISEKSKTDLGPESPQNKRTILGGFSGHGPDTGV